MCIISLFIGGMIFGLRIFLRYLSIRHLKVVLFLVGSKLVNRSFANLFIVDNRDMACDFLSHISWCPKNSSTLSIAFFSSMSSLRYFLILADFGAVVALGHHNLKVKM